MQYMHFYAAQITALVLSQIPKAFLPPHLAVSHQPQKTENHFSLFVYRAAEKE